MTTKGYSEDYQTIRRDLHGSPGVARGPWSSRAERCASAGSACASGSGGNGGHHRDTLPNRAATYPLPVGRAEGTTSQGAQNTELRPNSYTEIWPKFDIFRVPNYFSEDNAQVPRENIGIPRGCNSCLQFQNSWCPWERTEK